MRSVLVLTAVVCYITLVLFAIPVAVAGGSGFFAGSALGAGLTLGVVSLVFVLRSIVEDGFW